MESTAPDEATNPPSPERPEGGPDTDNQPPAPPPESDPKQDVADADTDSGDEQRGEESV